MKYRVTLMHGDRGGEGKYSFEGPEDLLSSTPVRVMRRFMDSIEARNGIGHIDYEINAAMKNKEHEIVTIIGEIQFENDNAQPFMCMISHD
ncbi:MAG: hypothetical protein AAGL24_29135 [Pseudomonadota bacterium]